MEGIRRIRAEMPLIPGRRRWNRIGAAQRSSIRPLIHGIRIREASR